MLPTVSSMLKNRLSASLALPASLSSIVVSSASSMPSSVLGSIAFIAAEAPRDSVAVTVRPFSFVPAAWYGVWT